MKDLNILEIVKFPPNSLNTQRPFNIFSVQKKIFIKQNVYFINLSTNITFYKNQFIFNLVPTALTGAYAGYTQPPTGYWSATGGNGLPTVSTTPYITLAAVGSIGPILGFTDGTYLVSICWTIHRKCKFTQQHHTKCN